MRKRFLTMGMLLCVTLLFQPISAKEVVGWVEHVKLYPSEAKVKAKIDTGATTSSLHCECIDPLIIDGEQWVSFSVKSESGEIISIKKPVLRIAKIKRHFGEQQQRYVVKLGICLASVYHEEEVTLVDRSGFNYPMLIGRSFLHRELLVDPHDTFITSPDCKDAPVE